MSGTELQSSLSNGTKRKADNAGLAQTTSSSRSRTGEFMPHASAGGSLHGDSSVMDAGGVGDYTFSEAARRAAQIPVPPQPPLVVFSAHHFQWQQPPAQQQEQLDDKPHFPGGTLQHQQQQQQQQQDRMSLDPATSSVRSSTEAAAGANPPKLTFNGTEEEDVTLDQAGEAGEVTGEDASGAGGMVADDEDLLMGDATEALARVAEEAAAQAAHLQAQGQAPQHAGQHHQQSHAQTPLPQSSAHSVQAGASGSSTPAGSARPDYAHTNPAAGSDMPNTAGGSSAGHSASGYLGVPTDEYTPKKDQPFARSPELRVSHKLAERKRRKEMKELFDELRELLPPERGSKTSKWEILSKSIEMIQSMQSERGAMQRTIERLQREVDTARGLAPGSSAAAAASAAAVGAGLYRMPMDLNASFNNYLDSTAGGASGQDQGASPHQQQQAQQQQQQQQASSTQQPSATASQAPTPQYGQVQQSQQQQGQQQGTASGQAKEQGSGTDGSKLEAAGDPRSAIDDSDHV